jgi:hypothetical protein
MRRYEIVGTRTTKIGVKVKELWFIKIIYVIKIYYKLINIHRMRKYTPNS